MRHTTNRFRRGTNIVEVAAFTLLLVVFGGVVACGTGVTDVEPAPKPKSTSTIQGGGDASPVDKARNRVDGSGTTAGGADDGRSGGASGMPGAGKREADVGAKDGVGDAATGAQPGGW